MHTFSLGIQFDAPAGVVEAANHRLASLAPRSDVLHWLHCYWEPGEPWCPVERLVIAEMTPHWELAAQRQFYRACGEDGQTLLDELEGPNPRWGASWSPEKQRLVYQSHVLPPAITQRQWWLFQEYRCFAMPVWIVQGDRGGHKRRFNESEKALLRMAKRPPDPPAPGALPYATLDERTIAQLRRMDRLGRWLGARATAWRERTSDDLRAERAAEERAFRVELLRWLDEQLYEPAAEIAARVNLSDLPYMSAAKQAECEAAEERLLTETPTAA